jgi:hypothetical protein
MFSWWPVSRKDYTELEASYQAALAREKVNAARLIEKGGIPLTADDGEAKTEGVAEISLTIPPDKCARFWALVDAFDTAPVPGDRAAKYALWEYVATFLPEITEGEWVCSLEQDIFRPRFVKVAP